MLQEPPPYVSKPKAIQMVSEWMAQIALSDHDEDKDDQYVGSAKVTIS
jgi:hypothetical protein